MKRGKASVETFVEIESQNRYPTVKINFYIYLCEWLGSQNLGDQDSKEADSLQGTNARDRGDIRT